MNITGNQITAKYWVSIIIFFLFILFNISIVYSNNLPSTSLNKHTTNKDFEIDQLLDELLGKDPVIFEEIQNEKQDVASDNSYSNLEIGSGYGFHENLLESSDLNLSSRFMATFAEFIVFSGSTEENSQIFFLFLKHFRYFDLAVESEKKAVSSQYWLSHEFTDSLIFGLNLAYSYQNTFNIDEATENESLPMVYYHEYLISPSWTYEFYDNNPITLTFELITYNSEIKSDNYEQVGIEIEYKKQYENSSETSISIGEKIAAYEENTESGKSLEVISHEISFLNNHYRDDKKELFVTSILLITETKDNDIGDNDYITYKWNENIQVQKSGWLYSGNAGIEINHYAKIEANPDTKNNQKLKTREVEIAIAIKYDFNNFFFMEAELRNISYTSNRKTDQYSSNYYVINASARF